ncbi:hypothetical protein EON78_07120, partial [bacterium]
FTEFEKNYMMQVDSINRISELPDTKPVIATPAIPVDTNVTSKIEGDNLDIQKKTIVSEDPFAQKDKTTKEKSATIVPKPQTKHIYPKPVINPDDIKTKIVGNLIVVDGFDDVPDLELRDPSELGEDEDEIEEFDHKKYPLSVDVRGMLLLDDKVLYDSVLSKPTTDVILKPKPITLPADNTAVVKPVIIMPRPKLIPTPEPKDMNAMVLTTYKDIRGNNVQVRGDVVKPLNKLMEITDKKGLRVAITYSYRSVGQQQQLWSNAIKKYGSASAARKWVAPPGRSRHNKGIVLDITMFKDGKKISQREFDSIIKKSGFYRPMAWEGWHIEPTSTKGKV